MSLFSIFSKKPSEPTSVAEALAGTGTAATAGASTTKSRSRKSETRRAEEDEQLVPEKKRARRRLIGAVAIVLAIAIGLPMLLDSEPRPVNKNIAIQMGAHDEPAGESKDEVAQEDVQPVAAKPASTLA